MTRTSTSANTEFTDPLYFAQVGFAEFVNPGKDIRDNYVGKYGISKKEYSKREVESIGPSLFMLFLLYNK